MILNFFAPGTDSRLGWGFRLGDRADFQVLVELGPQTNTQPLANQAENPNNSKRNSVNSLSDELYAKRQHDKKIAKTEGATWLENWSKSVKMKKNNEKLVLKPEPGFGIGEIDAKSVIPEDEAVDKANDLLINKLKNAVNSKKSVTSTDSSVIMREKGGELDNVRLE